MRDIELYRTILGLSAPWTVVSVNLDLKGKQVVITVDAGSEPFRCPECHTEVPGYDRKPRRWRHLDSCQFTTWIEAEVPRRLPHPRGEVDPDPLGRAAEPAHGPLRAVRHRPPPGVLRRRSRWPPPDHLGRGLGDQARTVTSPGAAGPGGRDPPGGRRKGHREAASLTVVPDLDRSRVLYLADDRRQESLGPSGPCARKKCPTRSGAPSGRSSGATSTGAAWTSTHTKVDGALLRNFRK